MSDFTANFKVRGVSHKGAINIFVSDISYVIIDKKILIPWQWENRNKELYCDQDNLHRKWFCAVEK